MPDPSTPTTNTPAPTQAPTQDDPGRYVANIQGAIAAYKGAGAPQSALSDLQQVIQANYDKLGASGYFTSGDGQQLGHVLRQYWAVKDDPTANQSAPSGAPAATPAVPQAQAAPQVDPAQAGHEVRWRVIADPAQYGLIPPALRNGQGHWARVVKVEVPADDYDAVMATHQVPAGTPADDYPHQPAVPLVPQPPPAPSFLQNVEMDAGQVGQGLLGLPAAISRFAGNVLGGGGHALAGLGDEIAGDVTGNGGYFQAERNQAQGAQQSWDQTKNTVGSVLGAGPNGGLLTDLARAAGTAAGGQTADARRQMGQIGSNVVQFTEQHPVQQLLNLLALGTGGRVAALGTAGRLEALAARTPEAAMAARAANAIRQGVAVADTPARLAGSAARAAVAPVVRAAGSVVAASPALSAAGGAVSRGVAAGLGVAQRAGEALNDVNNFRNPLTQRHPNFPDRNLQGQFLGAQDPFLGAQDPLRHQSFLEFVPGVEASPFWPQYKAAHAALTGRGMTPEAAHAAIRDALIDGLPDVINQTAREHGAGLHVHGTEAGEGAYLNELSNETEVNSNARLRMTGTHEEGQSLIDALGLVHGQQGVLAMRGLTPEEAADPKFLPDATFHIRFGRALTPEEYRAITKTLAEHPGLQASPEPGKPSEPVFSGNSKISQPNDKGGAGDELIVSSKYSPFAKDPVHFGLFTTQNRGIIEQALDRLNIPYDLHYEEGVAYTHDYKQWYGQGHGGADPNASGHAQPGELAGVQGHPGGVEEGATGGERSLPAGGQTIRRPTGLTAALAGRLEQHATSALDRITRGDEPGSGLTPPPPGPTPPPSPASAPATPTGAAPRKSSPRQMPAVRLPAGSPAEVVTTQPVPSSATATPMPATASAPVAAPAKTNGFHIDPSAGMMGGKAISDLLEKAGDTVAQHVGHVLDTTKDLAEGAAYHSQGGRYRASYQLSKAAGDAMNRAAASSEAAKTYAALYDRHVHAGLTPGQRDLLGRYYADQRAQGLEAAGNTTHNVPKLSPAERQQVAQDPAIQAAIQRYEQGPGAALLQLRQFVTPNIQQAVTPSGHFASLIPKDTLPGGGGVSGRASLASQQRTKGSRFAGQATGGAKTGYETDLGAGMKVTFPEVVGKANQRQLYKTLLDQRDSAGNRLAYTNLGGKALPDKITWNGVDHEVSKPFEIAHRATPDGKLITVKVRYRCLKAAACPWPAARTACSQNLACAVGVVLRPRRGRRGNGRPRRFAF